MSGTPDMQFDFLDSDLHEDLYQVIKYSCNEVFSVDQSCQVLHLWAFFLEQFLGVANQQHESEVMSKNRSGKACIVHVSEIAGSGAVADESSKTASPGATDAVGPASNAQRKGNDQTILGLYVVVHLSLYSFFYYLFTGVYFPQ